MSVPSHTCANGSRIQALAHAHAHAHAAPRAAFPAHAPGEPGPSASTNGRRIEVFVHGMPCTNNGPNADQQAARVKPVVSHQSRARAAVAATKVQTACELPRFVESKKQNKRQSAGERQASGTVTSRGGRPPLREL